MVDAGPRHHRPRFVGGGALAAEMMRPAWPMPAAGGAVVPAMSDDRLLDLVLAHEVGGILLGRAAISPIMTMALGFSSRGRLEAINEIRPPLTGSPRRPISVDWPSRPVVCANAS